MNDRNDRNSLIHRIRARLHAYARKTSDKGKSVISVMRAEPPRGVVFNFALSGETGVWAIAQDMIKLEFRE